MRTGPLAILSFTLLLGGSAGAEPAPPARPLYYSREITPADLEGRTLRELELMRNAPFARLGRSFRSAWVKDYFARESVEPAPSGAPPARTKKPPQLSAIDQKNLKIIARYATSLGREELERRLAELGKTHPLAPIAGVAEVALSPDGTRALVAEAGGALRLLELPGGGLVRNLGDAKQAPVKVAALGFLPGGGRAYSLHEDGRLVVWQIASGVAESARTLALAAGGTLRAALSPDGARLAVADSAMLRAYELGTGKELWKVALAGDMVKALAFGPEGKWLMVAGEKAVKQRDTLTGKELVVIAAQGELQSLSTMAIGLGGEEVVLGGPGWVARLGLKSGQLSGNAEQRAEAQQEQKHHLFVLPNGKTALIGSQPGRVMLWDLAKAEPVWRHRLSERAFGERFALALGEGGKSFLAGTPDRAATGWDLELWDTESGMPAGGFLGPAAATIERRLLGRALGQKPEGLTEVTPLEDPGLLDQALAEDTLKPLSLRELRLVRSTIQARRGRRFTGELVPQYFARMSWYQPSPRYSDALLTLIDRQNLALIAKLEAAAAGKGARAPQSDDAWFSDSD